MRTWLLVLSLFLISADARSQKKKKALFIIVDGIPADLIERDAVAPNIKRIGNEGGFARAYLGGERNGYSETPTISAVGYNSLLTATWANKHNVWDNSIKAPNYHYPTIFKMVRDAAPEKKLAIFSTWLDNRTKLVGEGKDETNKLMIDYKLDGLELDTVNYPHDKESNYIHLIDEAITQAAINSIKQHGPDLTWVYLQYTDDVSHKYGNSVQFDSAIAIADRQIGNIYDAILQREAQYNEDWLIFVTTDHGRDGITGHHHGGQTARERTIWMSTNVQGLNKYYYAATPAVVDITPTIMKFLGLSVNKLAERELDGIPLIGEVSIASAFALIRGNELNVGWDPYDDEGVVKIYFASTNEYKKSGIPDELQLLGEVDVRKGKATFNIPSVKSDMYKIIFEAKYNTLNRWVSF